MATPNTLIYGFHPVREALRHRPSDVVRLLVGRSRGGARRLELERLCKDHGVAWVEVEEKELRGVSATVHNGFAAELRAIPTPNRSGPDPDLIVLVEDIQDPRNLGALLRVCEAAGVSRVLIRDRGSAPLSPVVAKAAAGATEWLAAERITNSAQALEHLKSEGFWIFGADATGVPPWQVDLTGKVVLCLGGEEGGLRQRTRGLCDHLVGLPMRGHVESLNLATAASALLYEAVRQRCSMSSPPSPSPQP